MAECRASLPTSSSAVAATMWTLAVTSPHRPSWPAMTMSQIYWKNGATVNSQLFVGRLCGFLINHVFLFTVLYLFIFLHIYLSCMASKWL